VQYGGPPDLFLFRTPHRSDAAAANPPEALAIVVTVVPMPQPEHENQVHPATIS